MRFSFLIAFLLFAVAAFSTASAMPADIRDRLESDTFALINKYRKEQNLPPFKWNDGIAKIAREHSRDMASGVVDFGHGGFADRIRQLKVLKSGFEGAGENVFMADSTDNLAQRAVDTWLHSPHHLKNIRGDYNYSGLGVWQDKDGVFYFTQIFLKIESPTEEAQVQPQQPAPIFGILANPETRPQR